MSNSAERPSERAMREVSEKSQVLNAIVSVTSPFGVELSAHTRDGNERLFEQEIMRLAENLRKRFGPAYRIQVNR